MRKGQHKNLKKYLKVCLILIFAILNSYAVQATDLETIVTMEEATGAYLPEARISSEKTGKTLQAIDHYYKMQLDDLNQKAIYQALEKAGDLVTYSKDRKLVIVLAETVHFVEKVTTTDYSKDAGYLEIFEDFAKATHAYLKDHKEAYWIKAFGFSITSTDVRNGYITQIKVSPKSYYDEIQNEREDTERKLAFCARMIEGETLYERVKYIHDEICKMITYPSANTTSAFYHTIPCAWLETYQHLGVCEAYAKSFAYVCELTGIEVLTVTGGSRYVAGKLAADHMWNYVRMEDGQWYLVDCTWDDSRIGDIKYDYFLAGSSGSSYNHIPVGCFSSDTTPEYEPFAYPRLADHGYPAIQSIIAEEVTCGIDEQAELRVSFHPLDASIGTRLLFESSDKQIAEVSEEGIVTGKAKGRTEIRIWSEEFPSVYTSCRVVVGEHEDEGETGVQSEPDLSTKVTISGLYITTVTGYDDIAHIDSAGIVYSPLDQVKPFQDITLETNGRVHLTFTEQNDEKQFIYDISGLDNIAICSYIDYIDSDGCNRRKYSNTKVLN